MIKDLTIVRPRIGDIVILLLCVLLIPASVMAVKPDPAAAMAVQIVSPGNGEQIVPLHPGRKLEVEGRLGTSVIEILDGAVRFVSSPCSAQLCVLSGWHVHSGDGMACLPNRVAITLVAKQDDFDGMNF